ncbi:metallophosphoesterase [Aquirufa sp. 5-AUSEE-100C1]
MRNTFNLRQQVLFFALITVFSVPMLAQNITRGPYLQMTSSSSTRIRFRTDNDSKPSILIGKLANSLTRTIKQSIAAKEHEITIDSLSSNTRYFYKIVTETQSLGDSTYFFQTAPTKGAKNKISFWSTGDMFPGQLQLDVFNGFKKFIGNKYTNLYLTVGDNVYAGANDADFQANFFQVYQSLLKQSAAFPSVGNHDYDYTNQKQDDPNIAYFQNFSLPQKGELGGIPSNKEAFYSFDYGNVHFICLDSHAYGEDNIRLWENTSAQLTWLEQDLKNNKQDWTIVYFHYPIYTKGSYDSDSNTGFNLPIFNLRNLLVPIFDKYQVDMVLTGHSHIYERSKPLKGHIGTSDTFDPFKHAPQSSTGKYDGSENSCPYLLETSKPTQNGTLYVVNGVGGGTKPARPDGPHKAMYYSNASVNGSFYVEVENNRLDAKFLDTNGDVLDKFTVFKNLPLNPSTNLTIDYGKSADLVASWIGQYNWSTNQTGSKITVTPTASTTFQVNDPQKCFTEKFNVTVNSPLGTLESRQIPFDELKIYNTSGQLIKEYNQKGNLTDEIINELAQGAYILRVLWNGQEKSLKIVR